jgi:hypothetical protein
VNDFLKTLTINFKCGFNVEAIIIGMLVYSTKPVCVQNLMKWDIVVLEKITHISG